MSDILDGFKAAASGMPRDGSKTAEWLEGYDGYAIGKAENEAKAKEHEAYLASPEVKASRKALKAKLRKRCHSSTPRTL